MGAFCPGPFPLRRRSRHPEPPGGLGPETALLKRLGGASRGQAPALPPAALLPLPVWRCKSAGSSFWNNPPSLPTWNIPSLFFVFVCLFVCLVRGFFLWI